MNETVDLGPWGDQPDINVDNRTTRATPGEYDDWARVMEMMVLFAMGSPEQILQIADFGKNAGKHGEQRRLAIVSDIEVGREDLNAPCFNKLARLEAISDEIRRIDKGLESSEPTDPYSLSRPASKEDGINLFERVLRAASVIEGSSDEALIERRASLWSDGSQILREIRQEQAAGEWVDYYELRTKLATGFGKDEAEWVMDNMPFNLQRGIRNALASASGRWWGHTEALNGRTMDYSHNPSMLAHLPAPFGVGTGVRRNNHSNGHGQGDRTSP